MSKQLRIERVFDAPRSLVWKAFTDADEMAAWFGPVGYTVPRESVEVDLRVGGIQKLTMVPDDPSFPPAGESVGIFDEIIDQELICAHEDFEGEMAELFGAERMDMRLEFHDEPDGKTRIVLTQGPYSDDFESMASEGWMSSFTKLDALLAG